MKKLQQSITDTQIWHWIDRTLGIPRKQLGGMAVCPYVKRYREQIAVVKTDNPVGVVGNFANMKQLLDLEAVVVYGFSQTKRKNQNMIAKLNQQYAAQDVHCLFLDHSAKEPPLPVDYLWGKCDLLIAQRASTLEQVQDLLLKNTDYYTYYTDDV